jgi:hypothetical protein
MEDIYIQAYITDASHVQKVFGCKNKALLEKLLLKMRFVLDDIDDEFEDIITPQKNAKFVLLDIINGKQSFEDLTDAYIFVYEQICLAFGQQIYPPEEDLSLSFLQALNMPASAFMPIKLNEDEPFVLSITNVEIKDFEKKVKTLLPYVGVALDVFEQEQKDYLDIIAKAKKEKKDLVLVMG